MMRHRKFINLGRKFRGREVPQMFYDPRAQIHAAVRDWDTFAAETDCASFTVHPWFNSYDLTAKKNLGSHEPLIRLDRVCGELRQLPGKPFRISFREPAAFDY